MIVIDSIEAIPAGVPADVHEPLLAAQTADLAAATFGWSTLCGMLMHYLRNATTGKFEIVLRDLDIGTKTTRTKDILDAMANTGIVKTRPGPHLGFGIVSEGLHTEDITAHQAVLAAASGTMLDTVVADLVAEGRVEQIRTVLGVMANGWAFEVNTRRACSSPTIHVYEPGEAIDNELVDPLRMLNTTMK